MRHKLTLAALIVGTLVGVIAAFVGDSLYERYSSAALRQWHVYTFSYRVAIIEAAEKFYLENNRWPGDVAELVHAKMLPEWSEIFLPIGAFDSSLNGGVYTDREYVTNSVSGVISNYKNAPYTFNEKNGNLVISVSNDRLHLFQDLEVNPPGKRP